MLAQGRGELAWTYAWVPLMECYHGVLSMDHRLSGSLTIGDDRVDLDGGRGYLEKDWGKSFPAGWIWMQTNHFNQPRTSLSASIAIIPWLRGSFAGFIIGFWHAGRLYRFATYTGARVTRLTIDEQTIAITITGKREILDVTVERTGTTPLPSPEDGAMTGRILESHTARATVTLTATGTGQVIYAGTGRHCGFDIGGAVENIPLIP